MQGGHLNQSAKVFDAVHPMHFKAVTSPQMHLSSQALCGGITCCTEVKGLWVTVELYHCVPEKREHPCDACCGHRGFINSSYLSDSVQITPKRNDKRTNRRLVNMQAKVNQGIPPCQIERYSGNDMQRSSLYTHNSVETPRLWDSSSRWANVWNSSAPLLPGWLPVVSEPRALMDWLTREAEAGAGEHPFMSRWATGRKESNPPVKISFLLL